MKQGLCSKFLFIIAIMVFTFGCSGGTKERITGKWQPAGQCEYIEYFKDGSVVVFSNGESEKGKWSVLDDGRIKFEASDNGKPVVYTYKVAFNEKDEMTTTGEGNQTTKFTRVKTSK